MEDEERARVARVTLGGTSTDGQYDPDRSAFRPALTITTTAGNVADLRTRIVRDRLYADGQGGASLVREVLEAHAGPEVTAATLDLEDHGPLGLLLLLMSPGELPKGPTR